MSRHQAIQGCVKQMEPGFLNSHPYVWVSIYVYIKIITCYVLLIASHVCIVVDCGALEDPENGHVSTQFGTTYSHVANYSCEVGHQLNGSSSRNCTASGHWSPADPTCDRMLCKSLIYSCSSVHAVLYVALPCMFLFQL